MNKQPQALPQNLRTLFDLCLKDPSERDLGDLNLISNLLMESRIDKLFRSWRPRFLNSVLYTEAKAEKLFETSIAFAKDEPKDEKLSILMYGQMNALFEQQLTNSIHKDYVVSPYQLFGDDLWKRFGLNSINLQKEDKDDEEMADKYLCNFRCITNCFLIYLDKKALKRVLEKTLELEEKDNISFLDTVPSLNRIGVKLYSNRITKEVRCPRGTVILMEGQRDSFFYVVKNGEVSMQKRNVKELKHDKQAFHIHSIGIPEELFKARENKTAELCIRKLNRGSVFNLEESFLKLENQYTCVVSSFDATIIQVNAIQMQRRHKNEGLNFKRLFNENEKRSTFQNASKVGTAIKNIYRPIFNKRVMMMKETLSGFYFNYPTKLNMPEIQDKTLHYLQHTPRSLLSDQESMQRNFSETLRTTFYKRNTSDTSQKKWKSFLGSHVKAIMRSEPWDRHIKYGDSFSKSARDHSTSNSDWRRNTKEMRASINRKQRLLAQISKGGRDKSLLMDRKFYHDTIMKSSKLTKETLNFLNKHSGNKDDHPSAKRPMIRVRGGVGGWNSGGNAVESLYRR